MVESKVITITNMWNDTITFSLLLEMMLSDVVNVSQPFELRTKEMLTKKEGGQSGTCHNPVLYLLRLRLKPLICILVLQSHLLLAFVDHLTQINVRYLHLFQSMFFFGGIGQRIIKCVLFSQKSLIK